jgi:tRNA threonylcarbamoyl adenosine modification protein (Sua5/YciO/YrdC/YwlC family)
MALVTDNISLSIYYLRQKKLIIYPTDTVFGLGCSLFDYNSIKKIYELKGKNFNEPLSFACKDIDEMEKYMELDSKKIGKIKDLLRKGSHYTFVAERKLTMDRNLDSCLDLISKSNKIGIRIIKHPSVEEIVKYAGPIITTSANFHGEKPVKETGMLGKISGSVNLVLDGKCDYGRPSIVYGLVDDRIIRY